MQQVSTRSSTSSKLPSDYSVRRFIKGHERRVVAASYVKDVALATMQAGWFESKTKFEFAERQKREVKT